jgi:hypothetical protein
MPRPPDPNALRRDRPDDPAWTRLVHRDPAAPLPEFPLADPTPRELHWWADAWSKPQASEWEKRDEHLTVALFCRVLAQAEKPNAPVTIHRPLKQLRDELGLSVDGLRRRRWLMPDEQTGATAAGRPRTGATVTPISGARRPSSRDRFRRIDPAQATSQEDPTL